MGYWKSVIWVVRGHQRCFLTNLRIVQCMHYSTISWSWLMWEWISVIVSLVVRQGNWTYQCCSTVGWWSVASRLIGIPNKYDVLLVYIWLSILFRYMVWWYTGWICLMKIPIVVYWYHWTLLYVHYAYTALDVLYVLHYCADYIASLFITILSSGRCSSHIAHSISHPVSVEL